MKALEKISRDEQILIEYINLKLSSIGCPIFGKVDDFPFISLSKSLLANYQEQSRLLSDYLCPADRRIQNFVYDYVGEVDLDAPFRLPGRTFVLDRTGLARILSLPPDADYYESDIIRSYRLANGVLHNPASDRRTTQGVFHVAEGGLPVADDKKSVPKTVFGRLLHHALNPPAELLRLPFTHTQEKKAEAMVSLLLRPVICPEVSGFIAEKSMEIRFFAPGSMVGNLDFVESIFGNAGDPYLPENNAGLDAEHWSGHTGCIILAPHLIQLTKKELGLPHVASATDRQKRDGMCWEKPNEKYNDGSAFKITARDERGIIITIIADNYFGYCKKEVKTQISYAANLFGLSEEEHAGGAFVFPRYDLGEDFIMHSLIPEKGQTFAEVSRLFSDMMDVKPEGYAIDRNYPDIIYVPENVHIELDTQVVSWSKNGRTQQIKLLPQHTYVLPFGYKIGMLKPARGSRWRLIGEPAEGTLCHKPCTVSGGGKSEISKPIADAMIDGPVFVADMKKDFDLVEEIINRDFHNRFKVIPPNRKGRALLSPDRTLGSVIKLLTPSELYTDEYNAWAGSIPQYIKDLVFVVKRYYKPDWGDDWRSRFSVDSINGKPGNELRYRKNKINTRYVRVGYAGDGSWRIFGVRKDFIPSEKISTEDDITASVTVPRSVVAKVDADFQYPSAKFVTNCEGRFFQRPDDAIHRGYDLKTEADMAKADNFFCNYEPLDRKQAVDIVEDAIRFGQYSEPIQQMFQDHLTKGFPSYIVSPAHPRLVDGKPTKNPRYLQSRPDVENPRQRYLAEVGARLFRRLTTDKTMITPVHAVLPGRRNNPPEPGVRALCVFNPVHYMELPELFMEFISSITGKSPSTTGAGSEGALTKGPFNALLPIHDLNNAFVSLAVCGYDAFITAAAYVGPNYRVDHDISLAVPEIWSRMRPAERTAADLLSKGCLERCVDFEHKGTAVLASRLGYRITSRFMQVYGGRVFTTPDMVFTPDMLRPELQDMDIFVDAMDNIVSAHQWVAEQYFRDGSIDLAVPPLKALLNIMAKGNYEGKSLNDPSIRKMFDRESVVASDWYTQRLNKRCERELRINKSIARELETLLSMPEYENESDRLGIKGRLAAVGARMKFLESAEGAASLRGTIGADLFGSYG
jgi:phosphoenolpyruvate carboxykinase (diphosphate)